MALDNALIAFKKLFFKAHTSPDKPLLPNEDKPVGFTSVTSQVFGENPPVSPPTGSFFLTSSDGTVEYLRLTASFIAGTDTVLGRHGFELKLPVDYEASSSNPKRGTFPFVDGQILHQTTGSLQIVPPSFGAVYQGVLKDQTGTTIPELDAREWIPYEFGGIIYQETPPGTGDDSGNPGFFDCYLYIGKMASEVLVSASFATSASNVGGGPGEIYSSTSGSNPSALNLRTLVGTGSVNVSTSGDLVVVSASAASPDNFSHKTVPTGSTVIVPEHQQMLFEGDIVVDGDLVVDGEIVQNNDEHIAWGLRTNADFVRISASNPPTTGDTLVAQSPTTAIWSNPISSSTSATCIVGNPLQLKGNSIFATASVDRFAVFAENYIDLYVDGAGIGTGFGFQISGGIESGLGLVNTFQTIDAGRFRAESDLLLSSSKEIDGYGKNQINFRTLGKYAVSASNIFMSSSAGTSTIGIKSLNKLELEAPSVFVKPSQIARIEPLTNGIEINEGNGFDVFFLVSGSVGSKDTSDRGTSLFVGDVHISGNLTVDGTGQTGGTGTSNLNGQQGLIWSGSNFLMDVGDRNCYTGSGTVINDLISTSSIPRRGDMFSVSFTDGHLNFNGTSSEINFTTGSTDIFDGTGAVNVWFRAQSDGEGNEGRIATTENAANDEGWAIYCSNESNGNLKLSFTHAFSTTDGVWKIDGVSLDRWHMATVVYNNGATGNNPTIYLDGVQKDVTETSAPSGTRVSDSANNLMIGNNDGSSRAFDGDIDVVMLWESALNSGDVTQLYNSMTTRFNGDSETLAGVPGLIYDGLQFFADAGDRNSYPGFGTVSTDIVSGSTGTMTSVSITDGHHSYNGSTTEINYDVLSSNAANIFSGGGSAVLWIRVDSAALTGVIATTGNGTNSGWHIRVFGEASGKCDVQFSRGFNTTPGRWSTRITVDEWHMVVVTYDDGSVSNDPTIYIDGVAITETEDSTPVGTAGSDAGNRFKTGDLLAGGDNYDGDLDIVALYNKTLSAVEVQRMYNITAPRFVGPVTDLDWVLTGSTLYTTSSTAVGVNTKVDEEGQDVFTFVSGAIGSRGTSTRGTSLFGGDMHISGALSVDGVISTSDPLTFFQETITAENVTGSDVNLADTLSNPPIPGTVLLVHEGSSQCRGSGQDFVLTGANNQTIRWLAGTGTAIDLVASDKLFVMYASGSANLAVAGDAVNTTNINAITASFSGIEFFNQRFPECVLTGTIASGSVVAVTCALDKDRAHHLHGARATVRRETGQMLWSQAINTHATVTGSNSFHDFTNDLGENGVPSLFELSASISSSNIIFSVTSGTGSYDFTIVAAQSWFTF